MAETDTLDLILTPENNERLANLTGPFDQHLKQIEDRMGIDISHRGHVFKIKGPGKAVSLTCELVRDLYATTGHETLTPQKVHLHLQESGVAALLQDKKDKSAMLRTRRGMIKVRGVNQQEYIDAIRNRDLTFGIGPAGTGKTYLAVACGVEALEQDRVHRLILVRPAVEAGEKLGFLPGDLSQKIDPYLRPMFDALYEMLGVEKVTKLIERNVIEIAPLAYMRGRTLNDAFIIMDEAQNTTTEQMKMFLTRIGFGSTAVVTGDITQIDLPSQKQSGLKSIMRILQPVDDIRFIRFASGDVVRHPLVQKIIDAYDAADSRAADNRVADNRVADKPSSQATDQA